MVLVTGISVAQAATIINGCLTVTSTSLGIAFPILLIFAMRNVNSALTWSQVARTLHSSVLPSILRADSSSNAGDFRISTIGTLATITALLQIIAGIVTPLGLHDGVAVQTGFTNMSATYVPDNSPMGLATSPRDKYTLGRICGAFGPMPCPGNGDNGNTSVINSEILQKFNSTPYGPWNIQFRRYYVGLAGHNYSMTLSEIGVVQSLVLENGIIAIDGLIADFTDTPGIGFWNHSLPSSLPRGGSWTEQVLWMEPVTSCVNTNLTLDYHLTGSPSGDGLLKPNLTDRGGFVNLTHTYPEYSRDGQHLDLFGHAYKGAVLSNFFLMLSLNNMTREQSYIGKTIPVNGSWLQTGQMEFVPLNELVTTVNATFSTNFTFDTSDPQLLCEGYGPGDNANITNVGVHCYMLVGPPVRMDGGDPRLPETNSPWQQSLHVCASATRIRMQNVTFSYNGTDTLADLQISRRDVDTPILWGMEKTNLSITDIETFWGRIDDKYENDPTLWTQRSDVFYVPAGGSDHWGVISAGQASSVPAATWGSFTGAAASNLPIDYSGSNNFALLTKWQSVMQADPINGPGIIANRAFTDILANNLIVGDESKSVLSVAKFENTLMYTYRYGIPAFLLLALWFPVFCVALATLVTGFVRPAHVRFILNQTSVGRLAVGDSALQVVGQPPKAYGELPPMMPMPMPSPKGYMDASARGTTNKNWAKTRGKALIGISDGMNVGGGYDEQKELLWNGQTDRDMNGGQMRNRSLRQAIVSMVNPRRY